MSSGHLLFVSTGIYSDDLLGLVYCTVISVAINEWQG